MPTVGLSVRYDAWYSAGAVSPRCQVIVEQIEVEPPQTQKPEQSDCASELESSIAQIWSEVLHVDNIGRHDNFFELGGHSVLALQAVALARYRCGLELPIWAFFMNPTIDGLARYLNQAYPMRRTSAAEVG